MSAAFVSPVFNPSATRESSFFDSDRAKGLMGNAIIWTAVAAKIILAACLLALMTFSQAEAGTVSLGTAANYTVYVSGNMTQTGGDVGSPGSVAVGGNATMNQFTISGTSPTLTSSLVVGGNLSYTNAENQGGNVNVAGTFHFGSNDNQALASGATLYYGQSSGNSMPSYPHFSTAYTPATPTTTPGGIPINLFSGATSTLVATSATLAAQAQTGMVNEQYGVLTLTGSSNKIDYFTITSAELASANTVQINVPNGSGATVVVNVNGTTDTFGGAGMSYSGTTGDKVLFNFYNASTVNLSGGVGFDASLLAPGATLYGNNGHTDGNVMVGSITATNSSFEYHTDALFDGTLTVANIVPEPASITLAGLGILGAGLLTWRKRKSAKSAGR